MSDANKSCILTCKVTHANATLIFSFSNTKIAYAHVTKMFDNIQVEVGWSNEPPLAGMLNNALVQVNQTSGKNYTEIQLDLVESTQKLNFPDSGGASSGGIGVSNTAATSNNIGPQLQGIVSQLANDIDSTKANIDTLTKTSANTQKPFRILKGQIID